MNDALVTSWRPGGLALVAAALLSGCGRAPEAAGPAVTGAGDGAAAGPVAVAVVRPEKKTLRRVIEQPGFLEAFEETPLAVKVAGHVGKLNVDIGDRIRGPRRVSEGAGTEPGQVLAELAVPEMEEEFRQKGALVAQAEAEVEQAQAALEAAEAHVATSKSQVREAEATRTRAQANYDRWLSEDRRISGLVQSGVIDQQTRDEARSQLKAAEGAREEVAAKVDAAVAAARESEAKLVKARADLAAARARVKVSRADEARVGALLQYTHIRAPYDGVVTRRNFHTGAFLQPSPGGAAPPLFVVARTDTLRLAVDVPETQALVVKDGLPAKVRVQSLKDREFVGKVARTSWSLDPKARTLRAEIDLANPEGILRPGMYATVTFVVEFPDRLSLPATAVQGQGDQAFCYRVEGGRAVRLPVQVGLREGPLVEVLKKGTRPKDGGAVSWEDFKGDEVIAANASLLKEGQAVTAGAERGKGI